GLLTSIFENRQFDRYTPNFLMTDQRQSISVADKFGYNIAGDDTCDVVCLRRLFHSRSDINGAPVNADCTLRVTLLADNQLAALDPHPATWNNAKLLLKLGVLSPDRPENRIDRAQDPVVPDRLAPLPQGN